MHTFLTKHNISLVIKICCFWVYSNYKQVSNKQCTYIYIWLLERTVQDWVPVVIFSVVYENVQTCSLLCSGDIYINLHIFWLIHSFRCSIAFCTWNSQAAASQSHTKICPFFWDNIHLVTLNWPENFTIYLVLCDFWMPLMYILCQFPENLKIWESSWKKKRIIMI